jgi:hypothetical protein
MNQLDHDPVLQAAFEGKPAQQLGEPVSREDWLAGETGRGFLAACKKHPYTTAFSALAVLVALWALVRVVSPEAAPLTQRPASSTNEHQCPRDEIAYMPPAASKNKQPKHGATNAYAPKQPAFQDYQPMAPAPEPTPGVPAMAAVESLEKPKLVMPLTPRQQAYESRQATRSRSFNQEK